MQDIKYGGKYKSEKMAEAIAVAKHLFTGKKIADVKMTDIANECGIGVASLYRYFKTKEKIAIEAGILFWQEIQDELRPLFRSSEYTSLCGIDRIGAILDIYVQLYQEKRGFLLFLDDFDSFCLAESVDKESLSGYQAQMADFYKPYSEALEIGRQDGTVRNVPDEYLTYLTVNHAMLSLLRKMAQGEILCQDERYDSEIALMKEIILSYFKK